MSRTTPWRTTGAQQIQKKYEKVCEGVRSCCAVTDERVRQTSKNRNKTTALTHPYAGTPGHPHAPTDMVTPAPTPRYARTRVPSLPPPTPARPRTPPEKHDRRAYLVQHTRARKYPKPLKLLGLLNDVSSEAEPVHHRRAHETQ